jgi:radical SAM enzyme (TIGR01210 family)
MPKKMPPPKVTLDSLPAIDGIEDASVDALTEPSFPDLRRALDYEDSLSFPAHEHPEAAGHPGLPVLESPGFIIPSSTNIHGVAVVKLDAGIKAPGCDFRAQLVKQRGKASCYMFCTWPEMAKADLGGREMTSQIFQEQIESIVNAALLENAKREEAEDPQRVGIVNLYTAGSSFNGNEIPFDEFLTAIPKLAAVDSVQRVLLEARAPELATRAGERKLDQLEELAASLGIEIVLSIGFETSNPQILGQMHKHTPPQHVQRALDRLFERPHLISQSFMILKPAVMAEEAAIAQSVTDINFLADRSREAYVEEPPTKKININLSPIIPMAGTGAALNDAYKPSSYWSVIEVMRRLKAQVDYGDDLLDRLTLFFNQSDEGGDVEKANDDCEDCSSNYPDIIKRFNETQDFGVLDDLETCVCETEWQKELESEGFPVGTVHYPFNPDNALAQTLYSDQIDGWMEVEESFPEEARATRETHERRIREAGGHIQALVYHPENGQIIAYCETHRVNAEDLPEPATWNTLTDTPNNPEGNLLHGISIAAREDAPRGAAMAALNHAVELARGLGLAGSIGHGRIPGLMDAKAEAEQQLGFEMVPAEVHAFASTYANTHIAIIDTESPDRREEFAREVSFKVPMRGEEHQFNFTFDPGLAFHGRMAAFDPNSRIGPVVRDCMIGDIESLEYGFLVLNGTGLHEGNPEAQAELERHLGIDVAQQIRDTINGLS